MKIVQASKLENQDWKYLQDKIQLKNPLVLVFANRFLLEDENVIADIRNEFPYEHIVFGSTSGEIICCNVNENSASVHLRIDKLFIVHASVCIIISYMWS